MAVTLVVDHGVRRPDLGRDADRIEPAVDAIFLDLVLAILTDGDVRISVDLRIVRQIGDRVVLGQIWRPVRHWLEAGWPRQILVDGWRRLGVAWRCKTEGSDDNDGERAQFRDNVPLQIEQLFPFRRGRHDAALLVEAKDCIDHLFGAIADRKQVHIGCANQSPHN
jgi:hypothetical protein